MVFEKIKLILSEQFDVSENEITAETNLITDLNADSIDVVELIMAIEQEFSIDIPENAIENVKTVEDMAKYVEGLI